MKGLLVLDEGLSKIPIGQLYYVHFCDYVRESSTECCSKSTLYNVCVERKIIEKLDATVNCNCCEKCKLLQCRKLAKIVTLVR